LSFRNVSRRDVVVFRRFGSLLCAGNSHAPRQTRSHAHREDDVLQSFAIQTQLAKSRRQKWPGLCQSLPMRHRDDLHCIGLIPAPHVALQIALGQRPNLNSGTKSCAMF
jgi:hypothetical protein